MVEQASNGDADQRFEVWIRAFRERARKQGISRHTLNVALRSVRFDGDVVRRDRNQSEFTKTIRDYLEAAVSDARIADGKAALAGQDRVLEVIEAKYGVEKEIVTAIWGLESAYGGNRGTYNTIRSLATLAFDTRRPELFEGQLIAALKILENGDVTLRDMIGSWAGAMGHAQFMPTSYLRYAVDFDGDGKRDIWADDPTDALASAANYLSAHGWITGQPWGIEVMLPKGFDYVSANRKITRLPSAWAASGVVGLDGKPVNDFGAASVLLPAGGDGPAFLIFQNFRVLEAYNAADSYVIGVGHLADRIAGGGPIRSDWPLGGRVLTFSERVELQRRLTEAGFDTRSTDGKIGPRTIDAVRAYQVATGLTPDGYASPGLLDQLR